MMIISNSKLQQETEQTKEVGSKSTTDVQKSGNPEEVQKTGIISDRLHSFDRYVSEKGGEEKSYGHYEVVPDGQGNPKVRFDDPDKSPKEKASIDQGKGKSSGISDQGKKLQKLKRKQQQLKQQIKSETDPQKSKELKKKLAQIEREIKAEGK